MAEVVEINRVEELDHYHLIWKSLLPRTPYATFLQSLDCLQTYWRRHGSQQKLRVLIVYSAGEAIGILPLAVVSERTGLGRVHVLTYPLHNWCARYGPIGPYPTATLAAAMRYVRSSPRDWDMLDLRGVAKACGDHGRTLRALELAGFRVHERAWKTTAMVHTAGWWKRYWLDRPRSLRRALRSLGRSTRSLVYAHYRPAGKIRGDNEPRWAWYEACMAIANSRPDAARETILPIERLFQTDFHALASDTGGLDWHVLLEAGRPVAFLYNSHYQGRVVQLYRGCDGRYAGQGLEALLQMRAIQTSFALEDCTYEFDGDSDIDPRLWSTRRLRTYRYSYYPPSVPRMQLLRMGQWLGRMTNYVGAEEEEEIGARSRSPIKELT